SLNESDQPVTSFRRIRTKRRKGGLGRPCRYPYGSNELLVLFKQELNQFLVDIAGGLLSVCLLERRNRGAGLAAHNTIGCADVIAVFLKDELDVADGLLHVHRAGGDRLCFGPRIRNVDG